MRLTQLSNHQIGIRTKTSLGGTKFQAHSFFFFFLKIGQKIDGIQNFCENFLEGGQRYPPQTINKGSFKNVSGSSAQKTAKKRMMTGGQWNPWNLLLFTVPLSLSISQVHGGVLGPCVGGNLLHMQLSFYWISWIRGKQNKIQVSESVEGDSSYVAKIVSHDLPQGLEAVGKSSDAFTGSNCTCRATQCHVGPVPC